jgi:hypothetical protein
MGATYTVHIMVRIGVRALTKILGFVGVTRYKKSQSKSTHNQPFYAGFNRFGKTTAKQTLCGPQINRVNIYLFISTEEDDSLG